MTTSNSHIATSTTNNTDLHDVDVIALQGSEALVPSAPLQSDVFLQNRLEQQQAQQQQQQQDYSGAADLAQFPLELALQTDCDATTERVPCADSPSYEAAVKEDTIDPTAFESAQSISDTGFSTAQTIADAPTSVPESSLLDTVTDATLGTLETVGEVTYKGAQVAGEVGLEALKAVGQGAGAVGEAIGSVAEVVGDILGGL